MRRSLIVALLIRLCWVLVAINPLRESSDQPGMDLGGRTDPHGSQLRAHLILRLYLQETYLLYEELIAPRLGLEFPRQLSTHTDLPTSVPLAFVLLAFVLLAFLVLPSLLSEFLLDYLILGHCVFKVSCLPAANVRLQRLIDRYLGLTHTWARSRSGGGKGDNREANVSCIF